MAINFLTLASKSYDIFIILFQIHHTLYILLNTYYILQLNIDTRTSNKPYGTHIQWIQNGYSVDTQPIQKSVIFDIHRYRNLTLFNTLFL